MAAYSFLPLLVLGSGFLVEAHDFAVELLQTKAKVGTLKSAPDYWPVKGGNLNHSASSLFSGPQSMKHPSWNFSEPNLGDKGTYVGIMKVFHGSPVIDSQKNVYIQSTTGWVYSLDKYGALRWNVSLTDGNPGNLALYNGSAYTCSQDGKVWSLDMGTGDENWRSQLEGSRCPDDTHSLSAVDGIVLTACDAMPGIGSYSVCALSSIDGTPKWKYTLFLRHGTGGYNQAFVVVDETVYFGDRAGGLYAVSVEDGTEVWYSPGVDGGFTTGGMVLGPNNRVYFGFNSGSTGTLRALDLTTGNPLWSTQFKEGVNAQPAVGPLGSSGPLAVVVAVGNNVECELVTKRTSPKYAQILALDAASGAILWTFDLPVNNMSCMGNSLESFCCPDVWGQPSIGADGTVYANWSGGFALEARDANGDGKIDPDDPAEFSAYYHGHGSNGNTAIASGLTVAVSCTQLFGYLS